MESLPEYKRLLGMTTKPYSAENCVEFVHALIHFQWEYFNYIIDPMLLLPEVFEESLDGDRVDVKDLYKRQIDFFIEKSKRQEMIRILIDIRMTQDDIDAFLEAFNDAVLQAEKESPQ